MKPDQDEMESQLVLDDATRAAIQDGIDSATDGRRWSFEEALEVVREDRKQWTILPKDQSA